MAAVGFVATFSMACSAGCLCVKMSIIDHRDTIYLARKASNQRGVLNMCVMFSLFNLIIVTKFNSHLFSKQHERH